MVLINQILNNNQTTKHLGFEKERQRDRKNEKRLRRFHTRNGQKRRGH